MKKIFFTLIMAFSCLCGIYAQEATLAKTYQSEKKIVLNFTNPCNRFQLNTVGQVIVKENTTNTIRCEIKIVTFGSTQAQADARQNSITISSKKGTADQIPELNVQTKNGLYPTRHYNIVTTVYMPSGVQLQHNDNLNFMDLIHKMLDKIIP